MADADTVAFEFPDITEPDAMWAYVGTFVEAETMLVGIEHEDGLVTLPGVILPDSSLRDEGGVHSYFGVASEKGKEPVLLVALVTADGREYRFRIGAEAHGWAFQTLHTGCFLIVRDKDDKRALGIPCFHRGENGAHDRTVNAFEALACAWLHQQGTHPPESESGASPIAVSAEEIAQFKAAYPRYNLGEAVLGVEATGQQLTLPIVYLPEGRALPTAPADTNIHTTLALALDGVGEPLLGIHVEIEGEVEAIRFAVPGRQMGWAAMAVHEGFFCIEREEILEGKSERRLTNEERRQEVISLTMPRPGENPSNDQILALFAMRANAWAERQRMN